MKTRFFTLLFFLLVLSGTFMLSTCRKSQTPCVEHTDNYTIDSKYKNKIPYTGNDTLVLISNTNDTVICIGMGKITDQICKDGGGSPDCPLFTYTICSETNEWNFVDSKKNFSIKEQLFGTGADKTVLDPKNRPYAYDLKLSINNSFFYLLSTCISDPTCGSYLPTLTINGKTYNDVSYVFKNITDTTSKIYLNKARGILKIELNNQQQIWTLK